MKPQDFLVGIRDFFAVVVPGATLLACAPAGALPAALIPGDATLKLFAVAIAAYLAGSIASAVGSLLDWPVDKALESDLVRRRWKELGQREDLAKELQGHLLGRLTDAERALYEESPKGFWWNHLRLRCPEAIGELDRIEAAQKLFRSLVPVFVLLAAWSFGRAGGLGPGIFAAAAAVAFILYVIGRGEFLSAVYRYGAAYFLADREPRAPAAGAKRT